ncbi:hypothetical protein [Pseudomonas bohemica]|uniref:hypothetical protein n=1 Tax=Pseudomonas bohemica TaxID=2044872 RepID=UPI000DA610AD|nr:hypothetical protein [Pseudomonas bohemica]
MKGKPRGSTSGLEDYHDKLRSANTALMLAVIEQLKVIKPDAKWSYKEVWSGAGLKSKVALDSVWNEHVRLEIDRHNNTLDSRNTVLNENVVSVVEKPAILALKEQVKILKQQRDQALALIAQYAADTDFYKRRCVDLQSSVDRLKAYINSVERSGAVR